MASSFDPRAAYDAGLVGARSDPRADEEFGDYVIRCGGNPDGGEVAHEWEFAGLGAGKLTLLSPAVMQVFPGVFPNAAQLTGDCVAAAAANCLVTSLGMEIDSGKPDEVTGQIECKPYTAPVGVTQGLIARESLWAWRGYDEDGWVCSEAAKTACERGFLVRRPYPDLKIDLTRYTPDTIRLGGRRLPNEKWLAESQQHRARTATFLKGREQVRDYLAAGYGCFNCSGQGFTSKRDQNGVARQVGRWAHAQSWLGYDDRPEIHRLYGQALVLWLNQWGPGWISGPRRVLGTNIDIPEGSFWATADTIDRCGSCIALSSVIGWPRRKHTTYGATGRI
jgi:hypothetical protein